MRLRRLTIYAAVALIIAAQSGIAARTTAAGLAEQIPDPPRACEKADVASLLEKLNDIALKAKALIKYETVIDSGYSNRTARYRESWKTISGGLADDFTRDVEPLKKSLDELQGSSGPDEQRAKAIYKKLVLASNTLCEKYYLGRSGKCSGFISDYCDSLRSELIPKAIKSNRSGGEALAAAILIDFIEIYKSAYESMLEKDLFYR